MICPLIYHLETNENYAGGVFETWQECQKENCAWWDKTEQRCAILVLAKRL